MAGVPDETRVTPANRLDENETVIGGSDAEIEHRRVEHNANKAAKRGLERQKEDEAGHDQFSNIGPI
jgi:hypothetical protein